MHGSHTEPVIVQRSKLPHNSFIDGGVAPILLPALSAQPS
jgi:hypothetical protein